MTLEILPQSFSIAKLPHSTPIPYGEFVFFVRTDRENSLLCPTKSIPPDFSVCDDGWRGLRIVGTLDFSLIGILAKLSDVLARAKIGILAQSTFDTDYIFVKEHQLSGALDALRTAGYDLRTL